MILSGYIFQYTIGQHLYYICIFHYMFNKSTLHSQNIHIITFQIVCIS